jgi:thiamine biosynthesis lipoprotein
VTNAVARFEAIGVPWTITTSGPVPEAAMEAVRARIAAYDAVWSRFRPDSLVARIAREPGSWTLPAEAAELLELYRVLYEATDGRMSPLVGGSLERLGYDAARSLRAAPGGAVAALGGRDRVGA